MSSNHTHHDDTPHVYVVYWPEHGIIKAGITETCRWQWWHRRGAVTIGTLDTCCMSHARTWEKWILGEFAKVGARAFRNEQEAQFALGRKKGGYSECYRFVQSPRFGEEPEHEWDYERAYGLILPPHIEARMDSYFAWHSITDEWRSA